MPPASKRKKPRWSAFWEFELGVSEADTYVPPRGTRFNYLANGGGGVTVRIRPGIHLLGGLRFLHDGPTAARFGALTLLYWGLNAAGIWLLAWGAGLPSPSLAQSVVILGVLGLGLVVPNAPGFFGTFQIAAYSAMVLFFPLADVTSAGAAFVFLLYVIQIVTILVMGGAAFALGIRRRSLTPR